MHQRLEIEIDTFTPVGDAFLQVVAATCGKLLGKIVWRELEADPRQTEPRTWEGGRDV